MQGIDIDLNDINPSAEMGTLAEQPAPAPGQPHVRACASSAIWRRKTDTDLEGRGSFAGLAPGKYWIGMIGMQAISGDVRLRWDLPVTVRPGETTRVELNNLNATRPYQRRAKFKPLRFLPQ